MSELSIAGISRPASALRFRSRINDINVRGTRISGLLAAILVPLFSFVDWFVLRPVFYELLVVRVLVALFCIAITLATLSERARKYASFLSASVIVGVGLTIAVMCHLHDALEPANSPTHYYAGLILVAVGASQLCLWTLRESITIFAIIYLSYLMPTVLVQPPADMALYISNNFFLFSTILIAVVGQNFDYRLQLREFLASSELESANRLMEDANEKLKEQDRFKSQFFSNITHELKTPLTLILAPTEAIVKGELGRFSKEQQEYFRRIYQNGLRLMKLINDLLDLAKMEDSKLKLRIDELNLGEFAGELVANIKPLADRKNIELKLVIPETPLMVWADRHRLEQVFINLLANAVKFTPSQGSITMSVEREAEMVKVSVVDTGIGVPQDKLSHIFDRFSQVDGTTTRKFGGTGIGLALAKELTELHGGNIWAESGTGMGTTLRVTLPVGESHFAPGVLDRRTRQVEVPKGRRGEDTGMPQWSAQFETRNDYKFLAIDEATERRLVPRDHRGEGGKGARILVVEDSREMLQFIQMQLREEYRVDLAQHGAQGWDLVRKLKPDLVITDFMMPHMDGLELTRRIKSFRETAHIPVVMLTAKAATDDRVAGREAGVDEYLAKPFSTSELNAVVMALLKAKSEEGDRAVSHRLDSVEIMAGRLAHEIHNPLNYVKNGAFLVKRSLPKLMATLGESDGRERQAKLEGRINRLLDQISVGAERISGTVDQLKEYAREGYTQVLRPYDVDQGIARVLELVRPQDGVDRKVEYTPQGAGEIECHPQEFHEIVSNLVQNAFDATGEKRPAGTPAPLVRIAVAGHDDHVLVEVSDNGPGIPQEQVDKVFSPFFTTKEPGKGMGMGLTIVYRLVSKQGGAVSVRSQVGEGTHFSIKLPRKAKVTSGGGDS